MAKKFTPSVLTANHLLDGDTVWWTGASWTRDIGKAEIVSSPEAAAVLELLSRDATFEAEVVGPYLVEIDVASREPVVRREAIRANRVPTFAYIADPEQRQAA